ncbi:hypothetical protein OPV22_016432 [Ensete ventricosum]|uniref:Uncharacterized protein n=1 Tax=Ensete ventricosum TaxID=4639 RepID=A0AAV8QPW2_ENSVE|nr:hypothetical protein OPV22_016432 [Ensete ventricosum]
MAGSSTADSMTVVNTPSQDLALTNFTYSSSTDLDKCAAPGSNDVLVLVGDSVVLTLRYPSSASQLGMPQGINQKELEAIILQAVPTELEIH